MCQFGFLFFHFAQAMPSSHHQSEKQRLHSRLVDCLLRKRTLQAHGLACNGKPAFDLPGFAYGLLRWSAVRPVFGLRKKWCPHPHEWKPTWLGNRRGCWLTIVDASSTSVFVWSVWSSKKFLSVFHIKNPNEYQTLASGSNSHAPIRLQDFPPSLRGCWELLGPKCRWRMLQGRTLPHRKLHVPSTVSRQSWSWKNTEKLLKEHTKNIYKHIKWCKLQ